MRGAPSLLAATFSIMRRVSRLQGRRGAGAGGGMCEKRRGKRDVAERRSDGSAKRHKRTMLGTTHGAQSTTRSPLLVHDLAEHHVLAVQPRGRSAGDEELAPIGVGPTVSHAELPGTNVSEYELLVCKAIVCVN